MTAVASDTSDPKRMIALLQRQRDGYRELVQLSTQQSQLIKAGQPEQLLGLISQRQALIDEMAGIGEQVAAFHQQWSAISAALGEPASLQVRELVGEVEQLLSTIIEQDARDRAELESAVQQTSGELKTTAAAPQALNAYKSAAQGAPRFTDRQG